MQLLKEGTRVFNNGDICNSQKFGTIKKVLMSDDSQDQYIIKYDDNSESTIQACMFSETYKGNGSTRFVTMEAYNNFKAAQEEYLINYLRSKQDARI